MKIVLQTIGFSVLAIVSCFGVSVLFGTIVADKLTKALPDANITMDLVAQVTSTLFTLSELSCSIGLAIMFLISLIGLRRNK